MLFEIFLVFLKLGTFTIGGGMAMIPILRKAMVVDKKWFTDEEMVDIIAICQGLPGVIAVNMATYVGFKKRGFLGSLVASKYRNPGESYIGLTQRGPHIVIKMAKN